MRKALNFDLDTKKYERITGKKSPQAYYEIRRFLENAGFEHRQGSGYISLNSLNEIQINTIVKDMSNQLLWLKYCVNVFDVTNIGRQHSLLDTINGVEDNENIEIISNNELINEEQNIEDDFDMDICDY